MTSGLGLQGLAYLLFGFGGQTALILLGGLFSGIGSTLFNVVFFAYMQTHIQQEFYGRVISLVFFVSQIAQPLSYWVFGALADVLSVYWIFALCSLSIFVVTVMFYRVTVKQSFATEFEKVKLG